MRSKIVAGNWKMNLTFDKADDLLFQIGEELEENTPNNVQLIICPPSVYLELATDYKEEIEISIGAQNVSEYSNGAFTGEVSAEMLSSMEVEYCIIGHSERRKYFNENSSAIAKKIDSLLEYGIQPIVCIGEQLSERNEDNHFDIVKNQLSEALFHLKQSEFSNIIIAYEPVWAIGTGKTATAEQAQEIHQYIRSLIKEKYGIEQANETSILYGGSCNPKNAELLFSQDDVDGGLIGGASITAKDFIKIANSF